MPQGWSVEALAPYFQKLSQAAEVDEPLESVEGPDGLSTEDLVEAWRNTLLFTNSGAVLRQQTVHNVKTAQLRVEERGLSEVLVVLDEQYRVISGLAYCWALSGKTVPAVILHGAPIGAGWTHTHAEALKWGQTLWDKGEIQAALSSASPAERDYFEGFGFQQVPETTVLRCSPETFGRLGRLLWKQLGNDSKHDPAQLLYIESLRVAVLRARERIIRDGKGKVGDKSKLKLHLKEENAALERGKKLEAKGKKGGWSEDADGLWRHPGFPSYRFEVLPPDSADDIALPSLKPDTHPQLMELNQFRILARDHFGLTAQEASDLYATEPPEAFNKRLRSYVQALAPMERKGTQVLTEAELVKQSERLALWHSREQQQIV